MGWENMARRRRSNSLEAVEHQYTLMPVKHLQPFADQLIFEPESSDAGKVLESLDGYGTKSPTSAPKQGLRVVARDGVRY